MQDVEHCFECVTIFLVEPLTEEDIEAMAETYGVTKAQVRRRLWRLRQRLVERLRGFLASNN